MKIKETLKGNTLHQFCTCEVPTKYKTKIAKLLTEMMKQYDIGHKEKEMVDGFKSIFKSNLNWILDDLIVETREECVKEQNEVSKDA